ncbi:MAG: hypothetical protein LIP03_13055 [Bacteroidales bacterium]|nr:hypothetical protein [Bacteroidales bacterium]
MDLQIKKCTESKEAQIQALIGKYLNNPPDSFWDCYIDLSKVVAEGTMEIHGFLNPYRFVAIEGWRKVLLDFLKKALLTRTSEPIELPLTMDGIHFDFTLGIVSLGSDLGDIKLEAYETDYYYSLDKCAICYLYCIRENMMLDSRLGDRESMIRHIYTYARQSGKGLRIWSNKITNHFYPRPSVTVVHRGYKAIITMEKSTLRYYAKYYGPGSASPKEFWCTADDTMEAMLVRIPVTIDKIIASEEGEREYRALCASLDLPSIGALIYMDAKAFEKLLAEKKFDASLLRGVPGIGKNIPLWVATKCWDILLHGGLNEYWKFWIECDEDIDTNDEEKSFRNFEGAIVDNNRIKELLWEYYGIDIDKLKLDFDSYGVDLRTYENRSDLDNDYENQWCLTQIIPYECVNIVPHTLSQLVRFTYQCLNPDIFPTPDLDD